MKIVAPLPPNMAKPCRGCGAVKPLADFRKSQSTRSGRGARCRRCTSRQSVDYARRNAEKRRVYSRAYHAQNPERVLKWNLRKYRGMAIETYKAMLDSQGGACAICTKPFGGAKLSRPHVDHCHQSGVVRGLLCGRCNSMLGFAGDAPSVLASAAGYLRRGN